jgi:putative NIF3 family GTP cyclohydrolase 1 type 2
MKAKDLYAQLEKDFIKPELTDEWFKYMGDIADFICPQYQKRSMGLVCDFTAEVNKVYTAVFPSDNVMQALLDKDEHDAMLFLHHPSNWDMTKAPHIFQLMNRPLLEQYQQRHISIFNFHVPLDNYSDYSTGVSLANAIGLTGLKPFYRYYGSLACVYGQTIYTVPTISRTEWWR